jgi:hypothetical protein
MAKVVIAVLLSTYLSVVSAERGLACNNSFVDHHADTIIMHWRKAQQLVAYATNATVVPDLTASHIEYILQVYNSFWSGYVRHPNASTAYVRIFKCGNNNINSNIGGPIHYHETNKSIAYSQTCLFTFVRDPIRRWASAYNEIEYRYRGKDVSAFLPSASYYKHPLRTSGRVEAFIFDIVWLRIIASNVDDTDQDNVYRFGDISHVFPMAGVLRHVPRLDYVGELEKFNVDWPDAKKKCNITRLPYDLAKGQHQSSLDELGTYTAAHQALKSCLMQCILYHILIMDFLCYDYPPPPCGCSV